MTAPPFQTLLNAHAAEVAALLRGLVGPQEAEDCFQETIIAALRAYPPRRVDNLRGWLLTIAHRKGIDAHRVRARGPLPVAEPPEPRDGVAPPSLPDEALWSAVRSLPDRQRAAVALRYACDLPHREIAVLLDCSEEAARRSAHEGLKQLKEMVQR